MASEPLNDAELPPLAEGARVAAAVSTYHREVTEAMLASAQLELERAGLRPENWIVVRVPGAFELPLVARRLAVRDDVACVLCFGLVLKGETSHDVHIASATTQALMQVALAADKPVAFGLLTCDTLEQARARALASAAGGKIDKGREVARAALGALGALRAPRSSDAARTPSASARHGGARAVKKRTRGRELALQFPTSSTCAAPSWPARPRASCAPRRPTRRRAASRCASCRAPGRT